MRKVCNMHLNATEISIWSNKVTRCSMIQIVHVHSVLPLKRLSIDKYNDYCGLSREGFCLRLRRQDSGSQLSNPVFGTGEHAAHLVCGSIAFEACDPISYWKRSKQFGKNLLFSENFVLFSLRFYGLQHFVDPKLINFKHTYA